MPLSCVRFHVHQLKINGSHSLCSQGSYKEREKRREGVGEGEGGFFTWACHHAVQLIIIITASLSCSHSPPLSLSSIMMAVSLSSSNLLLLLMISSLDWLSSPGSGFLIDQDHMSSSGELLILFRFVLSRQTCKWKAMMWDKLFLRQFIRLSTCTPSNINNFRFRLCAQHAVDTCYHILCQTSVAECCVCSDTCGNVLCWANDALSWFGLSIWRSIELE